MRVAAVGVLRVGRVPQGEADPLTGVRPGRRRPHHEVQRAHAVPPGRVVPGQGDGQPGPQQPVGRDPRHVPAQQIGCQVTEVGAEPGGGFPAVGPGHGTRLEVDVDGTRNLSTE